MGVSPGTSPGGVVFITVNQVLVRLWARRGRKSDRMWSVSREGSSWGTGPPAIVADVFRDVCCVHATGSSLSPASIGGRGPVVLSQDDPVRDRSWVWTFVIRAGVVSDNRRLTTDD